MIKEIQNVEQASSEPTAEELEFAKQLSGNPQKFSKEHDIILKSLVAKGIASDFGKEGYGRGSRFHNYFR